MFLYLMVLNRGSEHGAGEEILSVSECGRVHHMASLNRRGRHNSHAGQFLQYPANPGIHEG